MLRVRGRLVERLLYIANRPVIVRAWDEGSDINLVADPVDPRLVDDPGRLPSAWGASPRPAQETGDQRRAQLSAGRATEPGVGNPDSEPASRDHLEQAIGRMRFAFGINDDLRPFYERFRDDPLLGPSIRHQPWSRPGRRPDPWEVLASAVTEQLIEAPRAHAIQRRIVWRWGKRLDLQADVLSAPRPGADRGASSG